MKPLKCDLHLETAPRSSIHVAATSIAEPPTEAPVFGENIKVATGSKKYRLQYFPLGIDVPIKLNIVAKGREFYKKPTLITRDSQGNEVKFMNVMTNDPKLILYPDKFTIPKSGEATPHGATRKAWIRISDLENLSQLQTTPSTSFEVDKSEVRTFKMEGFQEVPYKKPQKSENITITGYAPEQFANEYIYSDKVYELIEMDAKGKYPTAQVNIARLAKDLHERRCAFAGNLKCPNVKKAKKLSDLEHDGACDAKKMLEKAEENAGSSGCEFTPTFQRTEGDIGIVKNFVLTTGSAPAWGIISPIYADNGFSLIMRLAERPFTPQRIAFPSEVIPEQAIPKKMERLGALA